MEVNSCSGGACLLRSLAIAAIVAAGPCNARAHETDAGNDAKARDAAADGRDAGVQATTEHCYCDVVHATLFIQTSHCCNSNHLPSKLQSFDLDCCGKFSTAEGLSGSCVMSNPSEWNELFLLQAYMQNQQLQQRMQELRNDPEFKDMFEEIQKGGMGALMKFMNDPKVILQEHTTTACTTCCFQLMPFSGTSKVLLIGHDGLLGMICWLYFFSLLCAGAG